MRIRRYQVALCFIFIASVLIRIPNFNRPLSKHHEFNAAMVLIGMDHWSENGGASSTLYCPVLNYNNPGDRFLDLETSLLTDAKGNLIYASFGAGWFLYPYYFFQLFSLTPSVAALTIFNLLLSFICMLLVFSIARKVFAEQDTIRPFKSLITVFIFVLNPCTLWYNGNGYVHEVMVLPFFLMQVNLFIDFMKCDSQLSKFKLFLFFVVTVLGVFADWLSVIWLAVTFMYAIKKVAADRKWRIYLTVAFTSGLFSVLLVVLHYGYSLGVNEYLTALAERYQSRGFLNVNIRSAGYMLLKIVKHYFTAYASILLLIAVAGSLYLVQIAKRKEPLARLPVFSKEIIFLIFSTAFLHHFLFIEFSSVHEYAVFKSALFLSLASSVLLFASKVPHKLMLVVFFIVTLVQYYYINRVGEISLNGDRYDYTVVTGKIINQNTGADEVVFVDDSQMRPQISYYAKRTILNAASLIQAKLGLEKQPGKSKGVWFDIENGKVVSIVHFHLE